MLPMETYMGRELIGLCSPAEKKTAKRKWAKARRRHARQEVSLDEALVLADAARAMEQARRDLFIDEIMRLDREYYGDDSPYDA